MMQRRGFMQHLLGLATALLLLPASSLAALVSRPWNKAAFESNALDEALKGLNIDAQALRATDSIQILAPDRAENGAVVQIEVTSLIADTQAILILVSKNPTPLIANFSFGQNTEAYVVTRIKMAESDEVQAIVQAGGQYYKAGKRVEVLADGCN